MSERDASAVRPTRRSTSVPHHVAIVPGALLLHSWSVGLMGGVSVHERTGQVPETVWQMAGWRTKRGVAAGVSATHVAAHVKRSTALMEMASAPMTGITYSSLGEIDKLTSIWCTRCGGGISPVSSI